MRQLAFAAALACAMAVTIELHSNAAPPQPDPGALVAISSSSRVGVLLDEIPAFMRTRVAAALAAKPDAFWRDRAVQQLRLTSYRLVFREFFYGGRKQLPLPPEPLWQITLVGRPVRRTIDGHDVVAIDYRFSSTLLTDAESPAVSEPRLRKIGGTWSEPFLLPVDPEMLFQRTGYACMDEEDFPFTSVDSEATDSFYDQTCTPEKTLNNVGQCHATRLERRSCVEAVRDEIGRVETTVQYERIPWDAALADTVRYGAVTGDGPDLEVYLPDFLPSRITYRYIHHTGCDVEERSVTGTGWRRLLQFATSDKNAGIQPLTIGGVDYTVTGRAGELDAHNLFEFSPCHRHYHFKYYGTLEWTASEISNSKQGFCLRSTARTDNREGSPLHNPFGGCDFQGVAAGWVNQYKAGLPGQWIDISGLAPGTSTRRFRSNPNGFLCEGRFVDAAGNPIGPRDPVVWAPTGLTAENGEPVEAPLCQLSPGWDSNNSHETTETIPPPGEGLTTTPCARGQIGPLRNCGMRIAVAKQACSAGQPERVTLSVGRNAAPQMVRLCEFSHALDSPIACRYEDSFVPLSPGVSDQPYTLGSAIVTANAPLELEFTCPASRTGGAFEPGGAYSVYTGPVFPDDGHSPVRVITGRPLLPRASFRY